LSFALISYRSFPGALRAKPLLAVALILAGCGGAGSSKWQQVRGNGFQYNAPADWTVEGTAASSGPVDRVEVLVFRLLRPYNPAQRRATMRELDRVADGLASQQKGSVSSRRSIQVGGLDARTYAVAFDGKVEKITFVLEDRREYQLLCRRPEGGADDPCAELLESFQTS
jgi:hypothetical protein